MVRLKLTNNKIEKILLPLPITTHHSNVSISIDFFFVHTFLTSKLAKLTFATTKYHKTRGMEAIIKTLNKIRKIYSSRDFRVKNVYGDN